MAGLGKLSLGMEAPTSSGYRSSGIGRMYATLALAAVALFGGGELRAAPTDGKMFIGNPDGSYSAVRMEVPDAKPKYSTNQPTSYPVNTNKPLIEFPLRFIDVGVSGSPESLAKSGRSIPGNYPTGQNGSQPLNTNGGGFIKAPNWEADIDSIVDANMRILNLPPVRKATPNTQLGSTSSAPPGAQVPSRTITSGWAGYKRPAGALEDLPRYGSIPKPRQKVQYASPFKLTAADLNGMSGNTNGTGNTASYTVRWQRPSYRFGAAADDGFVTAPAAAPSTQSSKRTVSTGTGPIDPVVLGAAGTSAQNGVTSYKMAGDTTSTGGASLSGVLPSSVSPKSTIASAGPSLAGVMPSPITAASIPSGYSSTLTLSGDNTVTVTMAPTLELTAPTIAMAAAPQTDYAALGNSAPKTASLMSAGGATTQGYGTLNGGNIPWRYQTYIASDWSNLPYITGGSSQNDSTIKCTASGTVRYGNGDDVPDGNAVIFYDKSDRQVVGWFDINPLNWGYYDLRTAGYGMFFDSDEIPGDQGWVDATEIGTLLKDSDGRFFNASFVGTPPTFSDTYIGVHNITIGSEIVIVPELDTGTMTALGLGALAFWRRWRVRRHVDSRGFEYNTYEPIPEDDTNQPKSA